MTEIKLRIEDITDAFMRGYQQGVKDAFRDINKTLERSLHEQIKHMTVTDQSEPKTEREGD